MYTPKVFPGPSNYTEKDYLKFVDEIYNDKPLTNCKNLEPYRDTIKTLFNGYNIKFLQTLDYDQYNSWTHAVDDSVFIATHANNEKINLKTIKYFKEATAPNVYRLSRMLFSLYCPNEMVNNLPEYLWFSDMTFGCACLEVHRKRKEKEIDTGHPLLNEVFNYFYEIYLRDDNEYYEKISHHERIIFVVLAYLHLNNAFDIKLFKDFIDNIDNMTIKVPINDNEYKYVKVSEFEHEWVAGSQPYEQEIYKYMFNNMDIGFTKQKQFIR